MGVVGSKVEGCKADFIIQFTYTSSRAAGCQHYLICLARRGLRCLL